MLKKVVIVLMIMSLMSITGCRIKERVPRLAIQDLSEREQFLLQLTGNQVFIYDLKDLPSDIKYQIQVIYEVYEGGKKLQEQAIATIYNDTPSEKYRNETLALTIDEDKIKFSWVSADVSTNGKFTIEEDLSKYIQTWFNNKVDLNIGTELYIYHAHSGDSTLKTIALGTPVKAEAFNKTLNANVKNIFLKLVFMEAK